VTIAWVLGRAGLLGAALCRALRADGTELFCPAQRFAWDRPLELSEQISAATRAFALHAQMADRWEIHWAAGVGTMSSTADVLAPETRALTLLLELLPREPRLMAIPGALSLASSAGAIYAGSTDEVITEQSSPAPTTAYAIEKLRQEELLQTFVAAHPRTTALIARISTIYGAGQATGKKQGLLGHMARNVIRNRPMQIYVPFDTIRDYIDADDAALAMIGVMRSANQPAQVLTKIIASESPTTIAEIVSIFKRLARRTPLVVRSANRLSELYSRRVQFRSVVHSEFARPPCKRLAVGISQLMRAEHLAFIKSPDTPAIEAEPMPGKPAGSFAQAVTLQTSGQVA
jgi:UDP-glucose 4-epimerase